MGSLLQRGARALPCLIRKLPRLRLLPQRDYPTRLPHASNHHAYHGSTQLGVAPFRPRRCLPAAVAAGALGRCRHAASLAAFRTFTADAASAVVTEPSVATAALAITAATVAAAALAAAALAAAADAAALAAANALEPARHAAL